MGKHRTKKVVRRENFQGLDLAIEFRRGGKRPYQDDAGKTHFKTMHADYGEVRGTEGLDGDPVDVYVGPDKRADRVYVVTQMKKNDWKKVDEEKCILGVHSAKEARALYLAHYDDPRFCGAIKEMPMTKFQERLATRGVVGQKIASAAARIAELNYLRMSRGDAVLFDGAHGMKVSAAGRVDPAWDDDMPIEVRRALQRKAPEVYEDRKRNSIGETEITKMEQEGLGIPVSRIRDDPTDSKLRKAAALLRTERFAKEAAESGRVGRIADRLDDVGIGMLATPYALKGVGGVLGHAPGRLGAMGKGIGRAGDTLSHSNALELGGLALVAPGVTHRLAKKIDKRFPGEKMAGIADAAKGVVRGAARLGAGATLIGATGVGAGVLGAKKVLQHHPHQALSTPMYAAPRLF